MKIENSEILTLIPHRPPFLLVDQVSELVPDVSCTGYKFVGSNEFFFNGHFPNQPVMPGVLQIEALAQTGCVLITKSMIVKHGYCAKQCYFASIDKARFLKPVLPGSVLKMEVKIVKIVSTIAVFSGVGTVDGDKVVEADFKAAFVKPEFTLGIIKPDSVAAGHIEEIMNLLKLNGLNVANCKLSDFQIPMCKRLKLSLDQARKFYEIHSERPFYNDLCHFMSSGDSYVFVLEGQDIVKRYREIMGATNPASAAPGTIRNQYGKSIDENSVHGSDSPDNALTEISFFFPEFHIF